jgi:hypothetical protein
MTKNVVAKKDQFFMGKNNIPLTITVGDLALRQATGRALAVKSWSLVVTFPL